MSEDNKAKLRQFYEEVAEKGNVAMVDELVSPRIVDHNPGPGQAPGVEGVKQFFTAMRAAVTGLRVSIEHVISEGDKVAAHVSMRGKHTGELLGIPPSGKEVVMRISDVVRFENGKAVERWGVEDMSGFVSQA
jgi:predicted ester cyclase